MKYEEAKQLFEHALNHQKTIQISKLKEIVEVINFENDVKVLKEKKGVPTKISFNGEEYALVHKDNFKGRKKTRGTT